VQPGNVYSRARPAATGSQARTVTKGFLVWEGLPYRFVSTKTRQGPHQMRRPSEFPTTLNRETTMHAEKKAGDDGQTFGASSETTDDAEFHADAGARNIAEVLFPATPPTPKNPRVVKRFGLEDERKPRGLASAAGLFASKRSDPDPAS
jgi:hypothetical protein